MVSHSQEICVQAGDEPARVGGVIRCHDNSCRIADSSRRVSRDVTFGFPDPQVWDDEQHAKTGSSKRHFVREIGDRFIKAALRRNLVGRQSVSVMASPRY
jgi:hypothetical protein